MLRSVVLSEEQKRNEKRAQAGGAEGQQAGGCSALRAEGQSCSRRERHGKIQGQFSRSKTSMRSPYFSGGEQYTSSSVARRPALPVAVHLNSQHQLRDDFYCNNGLDTHWSTSSYVRSRALVGSPPASFNGSFLRHHQQRQQRRDDDIIIAAGLRQPSGDALFSHHAQSCRLFARYVRRWAAVVPQEGRRC